MRPAGTSSAAMAAADPREFDAPRGTRTAHDGLVLVDKPQGWTSHDVVGRVRRMAATRKVGHAGTLDPMATGVLVLGIGRATRLLTHVVGAEKEYTATIRLGAATVTDDAEGEVIAPRGVPGRREWGGVDPADLEAAMAALRGEIAQVPSSVSAIKVDGRRSYARVRAGEDVELAARPVTISRFALTGQPVSATATGPDGAEVPVLDVPVVVVCSSGTYVRALARDLGAALGLGGHLTALRRTRVGPFRIEDATDVDALAGAVAAGGELPVTDLTTACTELFPARRLDAVQTAAVRVGKVLPAHPVEGGNVADVASRNGPVAALAPDGHVVALLIHPDGPRGRARPVLVLDPA